MYIDGELDNVFKGAAAQSFHNLISALGFDSSTYLLFEEGKKVLR